VLVTLLDKIFDKIDVDTIIPAITDYSYDITR
jgi:nitrogenase molybdenum-iron protein beta chain